jgi:hypothetical protein
MRCVGEGRRPIVIHRVSLQDDSSRNVTENGEGCTHSHLPAGAATLSTVARDVPSTSTDALQLAVRLALDAGEYDRAAAVLDVLRRKTGHRP